MIRLALRNLRQHKLRTALTVLAVVLGVAMISGTYVLTDQIGNGFADIYSSSLKGVDVGIAPRPAFETGIDTSGQTMPSALLDHVRSVEGVAQAAGSIETMGVLVVDGEAVKTRGAPTLVMSDLPEPFTAVSWIAGRRPASGQIAVDRDTADRQSLRPGDKVALGAAHGLQPATISGIFDFGSPGSSMGGTVLVVAQLRDVQRWYGLTGKYSFIDVQAEDGVTPRELTRRLRAELPGSVIVRTGEQTAADNTSATTAGLNAVLRPALLSFGFVALLVGAFIIFNTFSITVAQRRREFALLRALGASRRQVLTGVIAEALALGATASVAGLFAGLGVAKGINALFKALGSDIPVAGIGLQPRTVVAALVVGLGVTLLATLLPAVRATRVPPVAALQEQAALPPSRFSRFTPLAGALLGLLGAGVTAWGYFGPGATTDRLLLVGLGAALLFAALASVARFIVRPAARVLGAPLERLDRTGGQLARENAVRNPARTASTAAALMIGLAVVVFVAVFAAGLKSSFSDSIDRSIRADIVVTGGQGGGWGATLPPAATEAVRSLSEVAGVTALPTTTVRLPDGKTTTQIGVETSGILRTWSFQWLHGGSDELLARLGRDGAVIEEQVARAHGLRVGERFTVTSRAGKKATYRVIGEFRDPGMLDGFVVSSGAYEQLIPTRDAGLVLARAVPGVGSEQVKKAVAGALADFPAATVQTRAEFVESMRAQIDQMLMMLYALLAVSVTISIFGIVNTLVLSVYERTREIGMLRAVGASRRQIRRMVRYESVITSVIGGLLGIAAGTLFAYLLTAQLVRTYGGLSFSLPAAQLGAFFAVSIIVGVVAAVLPARRAAAVDILAAIHTE